MKLYTYDHCPYCIRSRMIFGLKNVSFENHFLLNDDEKTPIDLVGKKLLPILIKPDNTAMGESLDIVHYIDQYAGKPFLNSKVRPEIENWLQQVSTYSNHLTMPRCVKISLAEFKTPSAIAYYTQKKSQIVGEFAENLLNTPQYIKKINHDLKQLEPLIRSSQFLNTEVSMEDILTFPILRGLTMVKGIHWPKGIRIYIDNISITTNIPLFDHQAI